MVAASSSQLRVFLSADLVNSTLLKNRLNHQELLDKYRSRLHVIDKLRTQNPSVSISNDMAQAAVIESLGLSTEDFDWAMVVSNFYRDLHAAFVTALEPLRKNYGLSDGLLNPWKAVGDELIYTIRCSGRRMLHEILIGFLKAVRQIDSKIQSNDTANSAAVRLKGSAWVAGFPVRNREIKLPHDHSPDYLGPDMDTGFRIGKYTRSGMLAVSAELAELLGECRADFDPMVGKRVGMEVLKGVWNDQKYPIIWIDFPSTLPDAKAFAATRFSIWDQEDCSLCKCWENDSPKVRLSEMMDWLGDLRNALPRHLGLVKPYISGDQLEAERIPEEHIQILDLLTRIEAHREGIQRQDSEQLSPAGEFIESDVKLVLNALKRKTRRRRPG